MSAMEKKDVKMMLVVPDVHGRSFWKDVLNFEGEIIFLGDYHDPYNHEFPRHDDKGNWLSPRKVSLENLKEIFAFAKDNPERVTLLLGNHDMAYIVENYNASRKDFDNCLELYRLYQENRERLKACKFVGNTIFTHAGISQQWYDMILKEHQDMCPEDILANVNKVVENTEQCVLNCSRYRGGSLDYSGPLWLDYHELQEDKYGIFKKCDILKSDKFQIFGHTYQQEEGDIVRGNGWAMIDSRRVFEVDPYNPTETLRLYQPNK